MTWWRQRLGALSVTTESVVVEVEPAKSKDLYTIDFAESDAALIDLDEDELGRGAFVDRIAAILANRNSPDSLVIGLYGPWGDGKSTVLNFVEKRLDHYSSDEVVVVRFNPWFYSSEQQIIDGFFITLAEALNDSIENLSELIGKKLQKLAQVGEGLSGSIPGFSAGGKALSALVGMMTTVSLKERKDRLVDLLNDEVFSRNPIRIVVIMDDLDRLERDQILTVFRVVKLATDLPHISYLLALDEVIVGAVLGAQYPGDADKAGTAYIEKIVQIPLKVPALDQALLSKLMLERLNRLLVRHDIELEGADQYRLLTALDTSIWPQVRTLRRGKRLLNAVSFALPLMPGQEVNRVDQVLVEAVRVLFPAAYDHLRRSKWELTHHISTSAARQAFFDGLRECLNDASSQEYEHCERLLQELFPRLQIMGNRGAPSDEMLVRWAREKRVCAKDYFNRYFAYGLPIGDILDSDIDEVVDEAQSDPPNAKKTLLSILRQNDPAFVIEKLIQRAQGMSGPVARALTLLITDVGGALPGNEEPTRTDSPAMRASFLITMLLRNLEGNDRSALAGYVLSEASATFSALIFRWLDATSQADGQYGPLLESAQLHQLGQALARRLLAEDAEHSFLIAHRGIALLMYGIALQYGDRQQLTQQVTATLRENVDLLLWLLGSYLPPLEGAPFINMLVRKGYSQLVSFLPATALLEVITHHFPDIEEEVKTAEQLTPGSPALRALMQHPAAAPVQFVAAYRNIDESAPPIPETVYEISASRQSPLRQYDVRSIVNTDDPKTPDLALRVGVVVPGDIVSFNSHSGGPPATVLQGAAREKTLRDLLSESRFNLWVKSLLDRLDLTEELSWQVAGTNQGDYSNLTLAPSSWDAGTRPSFSVDCQITTGREPGPDNEPVRSGLTLLLTISLRLASIEDLMTLDEFLETVVAALKIVGVAKKAAAVLLPHGEYETGQLLIATAVRKNDFGLTLDMSEMEVIPGNAPRSEHYIFSTYPLEPGQRSSSALGHSPETDPMRLLAVHLIRQIAELTHRRGYEPVLNRVLRGSGVVDDADVHA